MGSGSIENKLSVALDGLYEAVLSPEAWPDALDRVDDLFGSNSAHYFHWNPTRCARIAAQKSSTFVDNHPDWDYYHRINPRRRILDALPSGTPMNCADWIDDRAVSRSEFFVDYSLPAGRRYLLGNYIVKQPTITSTFAVMRSPDQAPFSKEQTELMGRLTPHLKRIASMDLKLQMCNSAASLVGEVVDRLTDAVIVVDESGQVVRSNAAAELLFERCDPVRSVNGRLQVSHHCASLLQSRITAAASDHSQFADAARGGTIELVSKDGTRWLMIVTPLMPRARIFDLQDCRLALVTVSKVSTDISIVDRLQHAFALTTAEARLADHIVSGMSLNEISAATDVRISTLRTQLKSVFAKTNTKRQAELVHLGLRLANFRP